MDVVRRASGREYRDFMVLADSDEISGEFFAEFIRNQVPTLFSAEDAMNEDVGIGVSHFVPSLPRDSVGLFLTSRHYRAGLSHPVPSALSACRQAIYSSALLFTMNVFGVYDR